MAKIFFNDRVVKTEKETTILNWFSQSDGVTIFLRDTRPDTYVGRDFVYGEIDSYKSDGDYYVDILEQKVLDGTVAGVFISEGSDFEIVTLKGREPLFLVRQEATAMSLGMRPSMNKGILVDEVAMGLFYEGSVISYNRDGINIKDELTKNGWVRTSGPKDIELGILNTTEAYNKKVENDNKMSEDRVNKIEKLKEALLRKDVNTEVVKSLIEAKEDLDPLNTHIFLAKDIAMLRDKGVL